MKILHLLHGFYGKHNGVDTYLRAFVDVMDAENIFIVPKGKNKSDFLNVIEIKTLKSIPEIIKAEKPDCFIIHYTGAESFKNNNGFVFFDGKIINRTKKKETIDFDPYAFVNVFRIIPDDIPIILVAHACFTLPSHIHYPAVNCIVSVSHKAYEIHKHIKTNHAVIYPMSDFKPMPGKRKYKGTINIGWLGNLAKYEPAALDYLMQKYGNNKDLLFLFAGSGKIPKEKPDNFKFLGNQNPAKFLNELDVLLYLTQMDSFSLALLESAQAAVPAIVSDEVKELGSILKSDIIDNMDSLDLLIDDIIQTKDSIKWILKGHISKKIADELFTKESFKNQWIEVLEKLGI